MVTKDYYSRAKESRTGTATHALLSSLNSIRFGLYLDEEAEFKRSKSKTIIRANAYYCQCYAIILA